MSHEERLLRELLWLRHGCPISALYGDDGELQCVLCRIDFKRESATGIQSAFKAIARARAISELGLGVDVVPPEPPKPEPWSAVGPDGRTWKRAPIDWVCTSCGSSAVIAERNSDSARCAYCARRDGIPLPPEVLP